MTPEPLALELPPEVVEAIAQRAAEILADREHADDDRWLDKAELAEVLGCGVRWIEERLREGMPNAMLAGRRKFRLAEVERWLEAAGHLQHERYGGPVPTNRGRAARTTAPTARKEIMPPTSAPETTRRGR